MVEKCKGVLLPGLLSCACLLVVWAVSFNKVRILDKLFAETAAGTKTTRRSHEPEHLEGQGLGKSTTMNGVIVELSAEVSTRTTPNTRKLEHLEEDICYAEALKDVADEHWESIVYARSKGVQMASGQHVLLTGLIRNGAGALNTSHFMLTRLGRIFADYKILVLENDSEDDTLDKLVALAASDSKLQYRTFKLGLPLFTEGCIQRMAKLRNMMHAWVLEHMEKGQWDLVISFDIELGAFGPLAFEMDMLFTALGRHGSEKWDVICANSLRKKTVYLNKPVGDHDCFALLSNGGFYWPVCWNDIKKMPFDTFEPISVQSCFGGLALYRAGSAFSQCKYNESLYDCEHVGFHRCLRDTSGDGRIFLDPMMTTYYSKDFNTTCRNSMGSLTTVRHKESLGKGNDPKGRGQHRKRLTKDAKKKWLQDKKVEQAELDHIKEILEDKGGRFIPSGFDGIGFG